MNNSKKIGGLSIDRLKYFCYILNLMWYNLYLCELYSMKNY